MRKKYPKLIMLLNEDFGVNRIDEGTIALVVSSILSIPAVMEGIARLLKKIEKKHHKEFAAIEKLESTAHKLHNIYQIPIKTIVGGSYRATHKGKKMDAEKLQKTTEVIFAIIVACLAYFSLAGAGKSFKEVIKHIKHSGHVDKTSLLHIGIGILETILGEMEIKEEIHLIQAIKNPNHSEAFAHAIDSHVGDASYDDSHEKKETDTANHHGTKTIHEGLSRGSLYRKRYYGRY